MTKHSFNAAFGECKCLPGASETQNRRRENNSEWPNPTPMDFMKSRRGVRGHEIGGDERNLLKKLIVDFQHCAVPSLQDICNLIIVIFADMNDIRDELNMQLLVLPPRWAIMEEIRRLSDKAPDLGQTSMENSQKETSAYSPTQLSEEI